jgi:MYXO-CTERM domain-containing protein
MVANIIGVFMRKTVATIAVTGGLLFGGAGVAQAAIAPAPQSTTTAVAADQDNQSHSDKTGLWGLLGLLGLGGLAGLKRRKDAHTVPGAVTAPGRGV